MSDLNFDTFYLQKSHYLNVLRDCHHLLPLPFFSGRQIEIWKT